ncbi:hypothetical protein EFW17_05990 [Halostreptopolyspora alba]|uniref:Uncharacterized protein n=1 Tax=Halostreptopolyspora alba TaxID=2487137 RepID=A0A3N0EDY8_9ACTN|nr:hypothetical protein EFW17_05990 [Nocardiopsaceae bacterium YIM 96095]
MCGDDAAVGDGASAGSGVGDPGSGGWLSFAAGAADAGAAAGVGRAGGGYGGVVAYPGCCG